MIKDEIIIDKDRGEEIIFLEPFLGLPFSSTLEKVYKAFDDFDKLYYEKGVASLHDLYSLLGLPDISMTRAFGWSDYLGDEIGYTSVSIFLEKKHKKSYTLRYGFEPLMGFAN